jgi:polar amino acid transport system substrate-binding protein
VHFNRGVKMVNKRFWTAVLVGLIFSFPVHGDETLRIYTNNYEPYYGENLPDQGPVIEIIRLAFKAVGYDIDVSFRPWKRIIQEGQNGECDVIAAVWFNTGRESWMALTDSMLINEVGFYKRKNDDLVFIDYPDLNTRNVVIGTVRGYISPEGFNQAGLKNEEVTEDILNLRKLVNNRIRLALMDKQLGAYLLKKDMTRHDIEWLVTLQKIPLRNGIMKTAKGDWRIKRDDFNKGLAIIKSKGMIEQVLKKHDLLNVEF